MRMAWMNECEISRMGMCYKKLVAQQSLINGFQWVVVILCLDDLCFTHLSLRFPVNHLHIS